MRLATFKKISSSKMNDKYKNNSKKFMKKYNKKKSNHVNQLPGSSSANARSKRTSTCL